MPAFAAMEARINTFTLAKLANVSVAIGLTTVDGVYDADYVDSFGIVTGTMPTVLVDGSVSVAVNDYVSMAHGTFRVHEVREDLGMKRLMLRKESS